MLVAVGNALKSTEAFLQGLQRSSGAEDVAWSTTGGRPDALVMFSRSGESAVLTNEEAHQYRRVIDGLGGQERDSTEEHSPCWRNQRYRSLPRCLVPAPTER